MDCIPPSLETVRHSVPHGAQVRLFRSLWKSATVGIPNAAARWVVEVYGLTRAVANLSVAAKST